MEATTIASDMGIEIIAHIPALRRYARTLVRSADQADDLVQDSMERALSRAHLYQPDSNLRAWLFTVMRNIAITQSRKNKLRADYAAEQMLAGYSSAPAGQLQAVELKESVRLVQQLSAGEKQALALVGMLELSYEEASQVSGQPVGTVKSRLSRARQHLRDMTEAAAPAP